ncbi:MAG: glycosyltransferase family 4 protein [Steroidobacteraceae bacterium]|jgi:glycosyltransferase involved in cell wall biosynthesis|nr:glycosyltransferase family 4 protein [Steroidobacteraceae bacterium]
MKVLVLGVRGIPGVPGGVETHAEQLYSRLAAMGCRVEVVVRTPFVPRDARTCGAVRLKRLWAPRVPGAEALVHSVLAVLYAAVARPDIVHIHAVGPAIVTPLARLLGLRVVVTHHGPDYERDRWGPFARWVLRSGERVGMRYSAARIAISGVIATLIRSAHGRDADLIPNGVVCGGPRTGADLVRRFGLEPGRYFLQVGRFVPEKRQLDLIEAYRSLDRTQWKLALVGGLGEDDYARRVRAAAREAGAVLTGMQRGTALDQLYANAGAFVLPSSHEGLPIALLEALGAGLPAIASAIPAHLEITLPRESYFPVGDVPALAARLREMEAVRPDEAARVARREWVRRTYDWDRVAAQTLAVYRRLLAG